MTRPTVVDIDEQSSLDDQAAKWVARLDDDTPSDSTLREFRQWAQQSPRHREAFEAYVGVWEQMNQLAHMVPPRVSEVPRALPWHRVLVSAPGLAACALVLSMVLLFQPWWVPGHEQYVTALGEQKTITLPDGSTALLNTSTEIDVRYRHDRRVIYLAKGEAHFDVVKNPDAPFEVHAGQGLVRAVGTAFGVYLRDDDVEVVVTEGVVELDSLRAPAALPEVAAPPSSAGSALPDRLPAHNKTKPALAQVRAGNLATYDRRTARHMLLAELEKIEEKIAWHQGLLVFDDEPLENVVAELARYTPIKILIPDPAVRKLKVGGHFKVGDTEAIFQALQLSLNLRVETVSEDVVYLLQGSAHE